MFRAIQIIPKLNADNSSQRFYIEQVCHAIESAAHRCGLRILAGGSTIHNDHTTLTIAVGGDGTMLAAMRRSALTGSVALGVNLGRVGFLSDISVTDKTLHPLVETMEKIFKEHTPTLVETRNLLTLEDVEGIPLAGNEISISQLYSDSMICYYLKIDEMSAGIHRANAIMVATATGSTAYSLSAGGALMMPDMQSMQVVPVAPLTLTSRPIVVSSQSTITIEAWGGPISIRVDGQVLSEHDKEHAWTKHDPRVVTIKAFHQPAKLLHLEGWNYFDVLTTKLGWIKE